MDDPRAEQLLEFVRRYLTAEGADEITVDTPLLTERLLDSMGITLLAAFVEEQFGVPFDGTELRAGGMETVRALVSALDRL